MLRCTGKSNSTSAALGAALLWLSVACPAARAQAADAPTAVSAPPIAALISTLTSATDTSQRRAAAYALGQRGAEAAPAVEALTESLASRDLELCWYAADALGNIGPAAAPAVERLVAEIENPENLDEFPVIGLRAVGKIGRAEGCQPLLVRMLEHKDPRRRVAAGLALWQVSRDRRGVKLIVTELNRAEGDLAIEAAMALFEVGRLTDADVDELLPALRKEDADVALAVANVIASGGATMVGPLAARLQSPNDGERQAALFALQTIIDEVRESILYETSTSTEDFIAAAKPLMLQAAPALLERLTSADEASRVGAELALAKMGPLVLAKLLPLLDSTDERLGEAARATLGRMQFYFPKRDKPLSGMAVVRRSVAKPMLLALQSPQLATRRSAVRSLSMFPLPEQHAQLAPLVRALLRENDVEVRRYAANVLEQLPAEAP
ncbi:MAG: HEAT repeat domain-containing protein [Planctomycetales bacterium]|nr:HEAT repeat domain-containing protein [Planctomycetales bacterium]